MKIKTIKKSGLIGAMVLLLMAFTAPPQLSQSAPPIPLLEACQTENKTFQPGEEIIYKLYYNWSFVWIPAGEVTFRVNDAGDQYHLWAEGRTYTSYDWVFKVRDYYQAYINKDNLLPERTIREVSEGKYTMYDEMNFDQPAGNIESLRGKTKEEAVKSAYSVDKCMHDILSVVYYARNIDFEQYEPEQEFPVKIFMDKEEWPLTVKYKGREEGKRIKGNGKFNTFLFSPEVIVGEVFEKGTEMYVWVSDDKNRIPLLIESPISVGSVKVVLKEYKGLKYDLSSKL